MLLTLTPLPIATLVGTSPIRPVELVLRASGLVRVHCIISFSVLRIFELYGNIFQANPGVVTTLDNRMHGLQTGDKVTFKEIVGMTALNGSEQTVKG